MVKMDGTQEEGHTPPDSPSPSETPTSPNDSSNSTSPFDQPEASRPPTLKNTLDQPSAGRIAPSSTPLGPLNAARRPPPMSMRSSGLTEDVRAKMRSFAQSRQGTPSASSLRMPPGVPGQSLSTNNVHSGQPGGMPLAPERQNSGSEIPGSGLVGGIAGLNISGRPQNTSFPTSPRMGGQMSPKPAVGGLAAKRGLKGGGMKLSDATGPPQQSNGAQPQNNDGGNVFNKYSEIVDTKAGTLNFKNKAVIHGGGIDFSSGGSFHISLDEVDTLDELGKGNYGTVYKVRHSRPRMRRPGLGLRGNMPRPSQTSISSMSSEGSDDSQLSIGGMSGVVMAMKEIRLELDEAKFAAIIMELDILHRCVSPFIVDFYGAFFQEGAVYICMEFMDGGSIDKLYGEGVPEPVLRKIALSTVMGLKSLKDDHNIIHRDVKPTNILVNTKGQVKICDFGVSGNLVASIAKTNIGCQSYMAPERISGGGVAQAGANPGGGTYSVQSDIWSLGLTMIECAMGRYPYPPETYDNIFSQLSVSRRISCDDYQR